MKSSHEIWYVDNVNNSLSNGGSFKHLTVKLNLYQFFLLLYILCYNVLPIARSEYTLGMIIVLSNIAKL